MNSPLFSTLKIGPYELAHRVVMPPLTRMRASEPGDAPTALTAEHYQQRATPGGLIVAEASQISLQGKGYPRTPGIYTEEQAAGWEEVVRRVHGKGGLIFLQLWHTGRMSHSSYRPDGSLPVSASAVRPAGEAFGAGFKRYPYETPRALETAEISKIVADYRRAAGLSMEAGFDGVEIHGANGYLIEQFLEDRTNKRTDEYGGTVLNRMRFLLEVTDAVIEVWGAARVGVRLSPFGIAGDIADSDPMPLFMSAIKALSLRNIAYLHLIEPRVQPAVEEEERREAPTSIGALFRAAFNGPLIIAGGLTKASAEAALRSGTADAIAFGRAFIANPDLPQRLAAGAPLNPYNRKTFYGGSAQGYTDYPSLEGVSDAVHSVPSLV